MKERKLGYIKPFQFEGTYIIPIDIKWEDMFSDKMLFEVEIDQFNRLTFHSPKIVNMKELGIL